MVNRTPRVVHVMRTYGVHGGERQLGQYFGLARDDVDAFIFLYRDRGCRRHFEARTTIRLNELLPLEFRPRKSMWGELALLLVLLPILQLRLLLLLKRGHWGICVVHGFQAAVTAWLAARLLRSTRFVYLHRGTKSTLGKRSLFRLLYRPFAAVAAVSCASAQSLTMLVPGRKPWVIQNGVDWQAISHLAANCRDRRAQRQRLVLTCVGRLIPGKGQHLVLQAFEEFHQRLPESELWLVGEGPDRTELESMAHALGLGEAVRFLGSRSDVACLLGQSDIYVHASESEGLSNAVLEAMAAGLASVVIEAPGVSECHVPDETGFIVSCDTHALASKLLQLAGDSNLRKRFAAAARERVRTMYSLEANRAGYARLYGQLDSGL